MNCRTFQVLFFKQKNAAQIFSHGQHFYHFKGLKNFKLKYADFWESKYLAYKKNHRCRLQWHKSRY